MTSPVAPFIAELRQGRAIRAWGFIWCVAAVVFAPPVQAAQPIGFKDPKVECNPAGVDGPHFASVRATVTAAGMSGFRDAALIADGLERIRVYARGVCEGEPFVSGFQLRVIGPDQSEFHAVYRFANLEWEITQNGMADRAARAEQAEADRLESERAAFWANNNIAEWVHTNDLLTNPFAYRGIVVGTIVDFSEMLAEDRALFSTIIVDGIDPKKFRIRGRSAVLALEITGREEFVTSQGPVSLPTARMVAAINCAVEDCSAFE